MVSSNFWKGNWDAVGIPPTVNVIPKREELKFVWLDHAEKPGIRVRNDFYFEAFDPTWATRNKMNGAMGYREQPGGVESYWAVHTFYPVDATRRIL